MILFIPFVGILKIVSDYIPELEALNILMGITPDHKTVRNAAIRTPLLEEEIINS